MSNEMGTCAISSGISLAKCWSWSEGFVVSHRVMTDDNGYETAEDIRAPSPNRERDTAPTADEGATADRCRRGHPFRASGDKLLEVRAGVVLLAGHFMAIDGASYNAEYTNQHNTSIHGTAKTEQRTTCEPTQSPDHSSIGPAN
jgi:hypothetical protein